MIQTQNKKELRRLLLQKRLALPKEIWYRKSEMLCQKLEALPLFREARTVLAYFSVRQEPDLSFLFTNNRKWGFPRCVGKSMHWHLWNREDPLQLNSYGILEPLPDSPPIASAEVDLILVPAVACDRSRYRLGYGGGFYDRMLISPEWSSKPTIGIIFDFAYLPKLPIDVWDRKLDRVCSETNYFS